VLKKQRVGGEKARYRKVTWIPPKNAEKKEILI
jgi:hypothetical protein